MVTSSSRSPVFLYFYLSFFCIVYLFVFLFPHLLSVLVSPSTHTFTSSFISLFPSFPSLFTFPPFLLLHSVPTFSSLPCSSPFSLQLSFPALFPSTALFPLLFLSASHFPLSYIVLLSLSFTFSTSAFPFLSHSHFSTYAISFIRLCLSFFYLLPFLHPIPLYIYSLFPFIFLSFAILIVSTLPYNPFLSSCPSHHPLLLYLPLLPFRPSHFPFFKPAF